MERDVPGFLVEPFTLPGVGAEISQERRRTNHTESNQLNTSKHDLYWKSLSSASAGDQGDVDKLVQNLYQESDATPHFTEKIEAVIKDIPHLQLELFESFFLFDALGSINIQYQGELINSRREMWQLFKQVYDESNGNNFIFKYAAYFYFRSKGWIVKNGLKFGTDFVLYKDGPKYNHSLFCVTVINVSSNGQIESDLPRQYISGLVRVSKSVQKHPIICFVKLPKADISADDSSVISECTIRCVHVERWDPNSGLKPV